MRRSFVAGLFLLFVILANTAFAQNTQLGGTVQDVSKALVPASRSHCLNTGTGVTSTQITNENGVYTFPSVPAGTYSVTAALPGFKTSVQTGVQVTLAPVKVNFTLEVGQLDSKVEVIAAADAVLSETAASVGVVLPQRVVTDLPLVGQNILSLLDVLPGFRAAPADSQSTIGGLNLDYTNTTIDGLSTVSSRDSASLWGRQVLTTNVINPDLVGEIRLILSPVDAELGRGNSQIQIQTRSGTNKFTGAAVWNVQNTALNANTWANKRNPGPATQPDWYNLHQITGSYGGPIIKNKTFFFVLFDKQMVNRRQLVTTPVLTDTRTAGHLAILGRMESRRSAAGRSDVFRRTWNAAYRNDRVGQLRWQSSGANVQSHGRSVHARRSEMFQRVWQREGGRDSVRPSRLSRRNGRLNNAPWDPFRTTSIRRATCGRSFH